MTTPDDMELLREYAVNNSEAAFATVVSRHINLVHAVAMRHAGNSQHAEEITQAVFIILAKKAGSLRPGTVLSGWLFHTARLKAANFVRTEVRRANREQKAYMQSNLHETGGGEIWREVAPLLDQAVAELGETDRNAVVLRFFEGKELREVGVAIGATEDAARKRVNRAVERLRKFFTRHGVVLSGSILASAIAANAVPTAPAGMAATSAALAVLKGATASSSTQVLIQGTLKVMAWTKIQISAGIAAALLLAVGGGITLAQIQPRPVAGTSSNAVSAAEIVAKVAAKYAAVTNYKASTKVIKTGSLGTPDEKAVSQTLSVRLSRPNLYLVESKQGNEAMAAWSDGTDNFVMRGKLYYRVKPGRQVAFALAGAQVEFPDFFLRGTPNMVNGSGRDRDERITDVDCYVLTNSEIFFVTHPQGNPTPTVLKRTVWVGKEDFLIHQWREVGTGISPDGTGTPDPRGIFSVTETHESILTNEPMKLDDFKYKPPADLKVEDYPPAQWQDGSGN